MHYYDMVHVFFVKQSFWVNIKKKKKNCPKKKVKKKATLKIKL